MGRQRYTPEFKDQAVRQLTPFRAPRDEEQQGSARVEPLVERTQRGR